LIAQRVPTFYREIERNWQLRVVRHKSLIHKRAGRRLTTDNGQEKSDWQSEIIPTINSRRASEQGWVGFIGV
jgi:hypothetical protein